MAEKPIDLGLTALDELFMTDAQRQENKLPRIRDIPLDQIDDMNDTFKVTLSVEMPCEITDSKGGTAEGNKIVFDIADITESQELSATCEENHTGAVIGITLAVVALVVGLVFLFKSKK